MEQMWQKLDDFIIKHNSSFKVVDLEAKKTHNRTDSLNIYMSKEITPEIAKELYCIIGPFLEPKYDEFLAGFPVKLNGKNIKGFKYGPEPVKYKDNNKKAFWTAHIEKIAQRDLPPLFANQIKKLNLEDYMSLGQLQVKIQIAELIYYLAGKEGKCPFQLHNQLADTRKQNPPKVIDIADVFQKEPATPQAHTADPIEDKTKDNSTEEQKSYVGKLTPQPFIDKNGDSGVRFVDPNRNVLITKTFQKEGSEQTYANGLKMLFRNDGTISCVDSSVKIGKRTEIVIFKEGEGCIKSVKTTGDLMRKIEEIQSVGLWGKIRFDDPKRSTALRRNLAHNSAKNDARIAHLAAKKVSSQ